jgi:hypothetical protein
MKQATIRLSPKGKNIYIISWDSSGNRVGKSIQNRVVSEQSFNRFVDKHGLKIVDLRETHEP